jgi:hypothetical protein
VSVIVAQWRKGVEVTGVGQQIQVHNTQRIVLRQAAQYIIATDETGATSYE